MTCRSERLMLHARCRGGESENTCKAQAFRGDASTCITHMRLPKGAVVLFLRGVSLAERPCATAKLCFLEPSAHYHPEERPTCRHRQDGLKRSCFNLFT